MTSEHCQCQELRRQRDCLQKYFYSSSWMLIWPEDLVKVLEEMKEENGPSIEAQ